MESAINLRSTVESLNQLQIVATKAKINNRIQLPQLVTVGAQSTGKSTLLDAIVGVHFLPRGDGIVTRTPVVLQLTNNGSDSEKHGVEDFRVNDTVCNSWQEVTKAIVDETNKIAGPKDVSELPIYVTIKSPIVPNLSLVDLPGLTKNAVEGQKQDTVLKINKMVKEYISNKNTIILAVSDAGVDIANSDSLEMARMVDAEGERTLGILTKMDRLEGQKNLDFLTGDLLGNKLKLGYLGVKCKKYEDKKEITMEEERNEEDNFFENPKFSKVRPLLGVRNLITLLEQIFSRHLRNTIPDILENINKSIRDVEKERKNYGVDFLSNEQRTQFVLNTIEDCVKNFEQIFNGNNSKISKEGKLELKGALKIKNIIDSNYHRAIILFDPLHDLKDDTIRMAITKSGSYLPSLFYKESVFHDLIKTQIARMQVPALQCLTVIKDCLDEIIDEIEFASGDVYINLKIEIIEKLREYLEKLFEETKKVILTHIESQTEIIDTEDAFFREIWQAILKEEEEALIKANQNSSQALNNNQPVQTQPHPVVSVFKADILEMQKNQGMMSKSKVLQTVVDKHLLDKYKDIQLEEPPEYLELSKFMTKRETDDLKNTKKLITCYIDIVKHDFLTNIPRYIRCFLVKRFIERCYKELMNQIMKNEPDFIYNFLLETDPSIKVKKENAAIKLKGLKECQKITAKVAERLKK